VALVVDEAGAGIHLEADELSVRGLLEIDPGKLAQGIGSAALRAFAERLVRQGYRTIVIDPDPENRRAVRAYERAGFRAIPRLLDRTGGTLIMQYEPKVNDPDR